MTATAQHQNPMGLTPSPDDAGPTYHPAGQAAMLGEVLDRQQRQGETLVALDTFVRVESQRMGEDRAHFRKALLEQAEKIGAQGERVTRVEEKVSGLKAQVEEAKVSISDTNTSVQALTGQVATVRSDVKRTAAVLGLVIVAFEALVRYALPAVGGAG